MAVVLRGVFGGLSEIRRFDNLSVQDEIQKSKISLSVVVQILNLFWGCEVDRGIVLHELEFASREVSFEVLNQKVTVGHRCKVCFFNLGGLELYLWKIKT